MGSSHVRLPPQPASVAAARNHVRDQLTSSGRSELEEVAVLLVSEVVTNALLHAGTDIDLDVRVDHAGVRVAVGDGSTHMPSRRRYATTSGTGRGLLMLESLVDDWGVTAEPDGKTVWFQLSGDGPGLDTSVLRGGARPDGVGGVGGGSRPAHDTVPVELRNMPLLLHAAWQEHAEALLREYLLASLDAEGDESIRMHADATDAIAVLEEHVPRAVVTMANDEVLADATEPLVSAARVEVPVPVGSVAHFQTLDRAIEAAMDLSREGLVLTPPTQPEVQAFRRWLCRQVLRQAAGRGPEPWVVPDDPDDAANLPDRWDPRTVSEAAHGVIAADHSSQILAASAEALRILGYDHAGELGGRRVVAIIPERLRQAHVAGFTMYLLVGRRPLLERTVTLPALRRDGTEVEIELTVRDQGVGEGHLVLLADLRPVNGG